MSHSPAQIISKHLISEGVLDDPVGGSSTVYPCFINFKPDDGPTIPDSIGVVMDSEGVKDGRLMSGHYIFHPGIQIIVRDRSRSAGYAKAAQIQDLLKLVRGQVQITIDSIDYTVLNVSQQSSILYLGLEEGTSRRFLHSINFLLTLATSDDIGPIPPVIIETGDFVETFNHASTVTIDADEMATFNHVHTNSGAGATTIRANLPPAVPDLAATYVQVDPGEFIIDPNGTDFFETSMGDLAAGQAYRLASAVSKIRLFCYVAGSWVIEDESGTTIPE